MKYWDCRKWRVVIIITMLCLCGCANKLVESSSPSSLGSPGQLSEQPRAAADPESSAAETSDALNGSAVEIACEPPAETPIEPESIPYRLDRSDIPAEINIPITNQKLHTELTYSELLDLVEQEGAADCVHIEDYRLTLPQLADLSNRYTAGEIAWKLEIDGIEIMSDAQELDFSDHNLAALGIDLYSLLGLLKNLEKINLCQCGFTNDEMAALQDAFPEIKIVWEIALSHWNIRTDAVAFSTMKDCAQTFFMQNEDAKYLKYCTDLVALDLGHNYVTDLSFLQYMPNLKILILVDNVKYWEGNKIHRLDDLSMLQYVPKLVYLEFFCDSVSDISFLQYTPDLVDLNISYNPISDATYLFRLPKLERLFLEHTRIPYSEFKKLKETYPDAQLIYYGEGSVDHGWRKHERYHAIRDMFENNYVHPLFAD